MYGDPVSSSMARLNQSDEVLGELQFSFVCFLVGQHYDSFEHWKRLTSLLCECGEGAVKENEGLYLTLLGDMHFQVRMAFLPLRTSCSKLSAYFIFPK